MLVNKIFLKLTKKLIRIRLIFLLLIYSFLKKFINLIEN